MADNTVLYTIIIPGIIGILSWILKKIYETYREYKDYRLKHLNDKIQIYWQIHYYLKIYHDLNKRLEYLNRGKKYISPSPDDTNAFGIPFTITRENDERTVHFKDEFEGKDTDEIQIHISSTARIDNSKLNKHDQDRDHSDHSDKIQNEDKKESPETSTRSVSIQDLKNLKGLIEGYETECINVLKSLRVLIHDNISKLEPDAYFGELLASFNQYVYFRGCLNDNKELKQYHDSFNITFPETFQTYIHGILVNLYKKRNRKCCRKS